MARVLDGRVEVKLAQPVGVAVGIALMAAPAVLGYAGSGAGDFHRVAGPLAASLALIAAWEATRAVRWPNVAVAAALVLAPLVVHHPAGALGAGVAAGLALGAATPFAGSPVHRFGGGWGALRGPGAAGTETRRTT